MMMTSFMVMGSVLWMEGGWAEVRAVDPTRDQLRLMLQGTPTPFSRTPRGTGRRPRARHPHRGPARRSEGGAPCRPSCCWAPSCRGHHSPLEPGDECGTDRQDADAPRRVWPSIGRGTP